ncbi:MAG: hypothetical protein MUD02_00790 [Bacteroidales bacterium]|jgi:hypothetical protein|nr:hypothetical protein [Bacteroidales bacterium]MCU0407462.1 hypothetical protein [Bacteroidales bacterium]
MKKQAFIIIAVILLASCKGRNSGPLVKDSFEQAAEEAPVMQGQKSTGPAKPEKISESISPCTGCITLANLLSDKKNYKGQTVSVTGRVVKFNAEIMGKNWVHIQDGTEADGDYDLTVTTMQTVTVGEVVTFTGTISLNKDFGYGYKYDILMEDATLAVKEPSAGPM